MEARALASYWVCGVRRSYKAVSGIYEPHFHNSLNVPINRNFCRDLGRVSPRGVNLEWSELNHLLICSNTIPHSTPHFLFGKLNRIAH